MHTEMKNKVSPENWKIAAHVVDLETSIIREILKFSSQPGVISFAGGLPAPESFPLETLKVLAAEIFDNHGHIAVQYSLSRGILPLREILAKRATQRGTPSSVDNILITSGAQQGIELVARAFIEPGDYILTEDPTYVGALQAFNYYQARYATVEMDDEGMKVEQVRKKIEEFRPKLIYTVSNFQNPTGITMSEERRRQLVEIAAEFNIPIIDDNPYGDIRFAGKNMPTLKSLGGDGVIALRSFSKIMAPGLRLGWMNGPSCVIAQFEKVKQCADLHSNTFGQYLAYEFLSRGLMEPHLEMIRKIYGDKRNLMLSEIEKKFPSGIKWTKPDGGLFLWLDLPKHVSARELFPKAVEKKVAFVYGEPFFANGGGKNTLRLNYSTANKEQIVEGIGRLAELFKANF